MKTRTGKRRRRESDESDAPPKKRRGGGKFQYDRPNREQRQRRATQQGGMYDSIFKPDLQVWRPKTGEFRVRFFPPTWKPAEHYGLDVWVHYGVGADNQQYLCHQKMHNKPCPICAELTRAQREDAEEEYLYKLKPKRRVAVWLIDRDDEDKGPQLYAMPWTMDRDVSKLSINKRTKELLEIEDPENGYDLDFSKSAKGGKSAYTEYGAYGIDRKSSPLSDDEERSEEWWAFVQANPIPDVLNYYEFDHIADVFEGSNQDADDDDKDDDGDEKVRTRRDKGKSKESSKDDDDDDDDDNDEIDDEDEDIDDEEDEAEEDEDGDEEEDESYAPTKGDRVAAKLDGETYEGTVAAVNTKRGKVKVNFDDGDKLELAFDEVELVEAEEEDTEEDEDGDEDWDDDD